MGGHSEEGLGPCPQRGFRAVGEGEALGSLSTGSKLEAPREFPVTGEWRRPGKLHPEEVVSAVPGSMGLRVRTREDEDGGQQG